MGNSYIKMKKFVISAITLALLGISSDLNVN